MKNKIIRKAKNDKGITLIALVITIIVLLILAGITLSIVLGPNGIIQRAKQAKTETEQAALNEQSILNGVDSFINEQLSGNGSSTGGEEGKKLPEATENTKPYLPDDNYIVIEDNPEKGLVVKDTETGNEYVWVEVPRSIYTTASNETDYTNIEKDMQTYAADYREANHADTYQADIGFTNETDYNNAKNKMLRSVYTYGGFWIGRYEMGTETIRKEGASATTTPLIQRDKYVYNYVTISQAKTLADSLSKENTYTSSLMYGIQWDLTMKYIQTRGGKILNELKTDSTNWGNYKNVEFTLTRVEAKYSVDKGQTYTDNTTGDYSKSIDQSILFTTGASERNCALNIYDLAGNVYEWTLEKTSLASYPASQRGGYYDANSGSTPAGVRSYSKVTEGKEWNGFRSSLYK